METFGEFMVESATSSDRAEEVKLGGLFRLLGLSANDDETCGR